MIVLKLLPKLWHFKSHEFCGKCYIVTCLKIMFLKYDFNIIVKLNFEDIISSTPVEKDVLTDNELQQERQY